MADMITVSALNRYVRSLMDSDENLSDIAIRGEISNFSCHFKTGHCYFSLKDAGASVKAVMFRSDAVNVNFQPENGMGVIARGRVSLFERDGAYQLYVDALLPEGVGLAQLAFEQLKARLEREGLFSIEAKKPIPPFPKAVGLVTSKTGAALQDILQVAERRNPEAAFLLAPVKVQGLDAAPEIARSIRTLDESGLVDIIIVARGGGSTEDLAVFNDEEIARIVFACNTPVISAIGHEIDFTILDFVADLRAPTPSAAAELALPNLAERMSAMKMIFNNIQNDMQNKLDLCYNACARCKNHPALMNISHLPARKTKELAHLRKAISGRQKDRFNEERRRLSSAAALASSVNPYAILARGYSIPMGDFGPIESVSDIKIGENLKIKMHDGIIHSVVDSVEYNSGN